MWSLYDNWKTGIIMTKIVSLIIIFLFYLFCPKQQKAISQSIESISLFTLTIINMNKDIPLCCVAESSEMQCKDSCQEGAFIS